MRKDKVTENLCMNTHTPEVFQTGAALDLGWRLGWVWDDGAIIWHPWKQKPAAPFPDLIKGFSPKHS